MFRNLKQYFRVYCSLKAYRQTTVHNRLDEKTTTWPFFYESLWLRIPLGYPGVVRRRRFVCGSVAAKAPRRQLLRPKRLAMKVGISKCDLFSGFLSFLRSVDRQRSKKNVFIFQMSISYIVKSAKR